MSECNQCGSCCKALVVGVSPQEAKRYVLHNYPFHDFKNEYKTTTNDYIFISEELKPLTDEQAIKINPLLKERLQWKGTYAYSCPHLTEDNKCDIHDELEPDHMCDLYKGEPSGKGWYSNNCGFKKDFKEESS